MIVLTFEGKVSKKRSENTNATYVSDDMSHKAGFFMRRNALIGVAVVVVALLLFGAYQEVTKKRDVAFSIDGQQYSKTLVGALVKNNLTQRHMTQDAAAKQVFQYFRELASTKALKFTPEQSTIDDYVSIGAQNIGDPVLTTEETTAITSTPKIGFYTPVFPKGPTQNPYTNLWLYLAAYDQALQQTYDNAPAGLYQGYAFSFDFSDKIIPQNTANPSKTHGNQTLIAADQAYAQKRANEYHDLIEADKITAVDLLAKIQSDGSLGLNDKTISFSAVTSGQFDTSSNPYLQGQVFYPEVVKYIQSQSAPITSGVKVATVPNDKGQRVPGAYYFCVITKAVQPAKNLKLSIDSEEKKQGASYYGL